MYDDKLKKLNATQAPENITITIDTSDHMLEKNLSMCV